MTILGYFFIQLFHDSPFLYAIKLFIKEMYGAFDKFK